MTRKFSKKQHGFTIIELLIVLAIIGLLAVFGMPFMRGIIIQGTVEPTANDISRVVTKVRGNFAGNGNAPYAALNIAVVSNTARGLVSTLNIAGVGAAATLQHNLGAPNAQIAVAPVAVNAGGALGEAFTVTLGGVNDAACPGLAAQLNRAAEAISVNAVVVRAVGAAYNPVLAQNSCVVGNANAFVFTFR